MRIGILSHSLPSALRIYHELQGNPNDELFILLCPAPGEPAGSLLKHVGRLVFRSGGLKSLRLAANEKVVLLHKSLEHPDTVSRIRKLKLDIGLHKAGVIYREPAIQAFRLGILNPHIGILPAYRGRNVMEWALLEGNPVGITVFFIDAGIDTGERIVITEEVDVSHCKSIQEAKEHLFDLDAIFFRRALEVLRAESPDYAVNDGSGRRHYVMSRLFKDVVQNLLGNN
jgi:methionyl-tRNA formyltransferase